MSVGGRGALVGLALLASACPTPPRDPPPAAPVIERFEASTLRVRAPETHATVRWRVRGADAVALLGIDVEPITVASEGERIVPVMDTRVITLRASIEDRVSSAELVIVRDSADGVEIRTFEVEPTRVRAGDPVQVRWDAPGSRGVFVRVLGERSLVGDGPAHGAITYTPLGSATVELRADGPGGPLRLTRDIVVERGAPLLETFVVEPVALVEGDTIEIRWATRGEVSSCTLAVTTATAAQSSEVAGGGGSLSWQPPRGRSVLTLSCAGPGGRVEASQAIVVTEALEARVVIDRVEPAITGLGGTVAVYFRAYGAEILRMRSSAGRSFVDAALGRVTLVVESNTFVVALEPFDRAGATATATVTVDLTRPLVVQATAADVAGSVRVNWSIAQAERLRIYAQSTGALLADVDVRLVEATLLVDPDERWLRLDAEGPAGVTTRELAIQGR